MGLKAFSKSLPGNIRLNVRFIVVGLALLIILGSYPLSAAGGTRAIQRRADLSHDSGKIGAFHALVIGIDDYADGDIPDLKTAVADAEAVAGVLKVRYGFADIDLLTDRGATKSAIVGALRDKIRSLGPEDNLLIYYAGHGELDRLLGDGWWVPVDARAGEIVSYLENTTVQKYLRKMKARHVLLVSDSCYSGTLFGESRSLPPTIDNDFYLDLYNAPSRWALTSGNNTPVSDRGFGGHSIFAHQFIRALENNDAPYLTAREIYGDIGPVIRNNSEQIPKCGPVKMTGDLGGEFVFILADSGGAVVDAPARPRPKPEKPEQKAASLSIDSDVAGATVWINGQEMGGRPPLSYPNIRPGHYRVKVGKDGYEPYERRVEVKAGRDYAVTAHLERIDQGPAPQPVAPVSSTPDAGDVWREPATGMEFVWAPGGCYEMGSNEGDDDEKPMHEVCVDGFWMGRTEVTQGQWKAVMGNNPSSFDECGNDCPVEQVSWNDAQGFIEKLNRGEGRRFRLPSEAEWEYACRSGGKDEKYAGGNDADRVAWYWKNSGQKTHPMGTKAHNGLGLSDMSGNIWEWCLDIYAGDAYSKHQLNNPIYASGASDIYAKSGALRVIRGGSWRSDPADVRCAFRGSYGPAHRLNDVGFRLLRTP